MKTAELTGAQLDWAVAKCEGYALTSDGINHLVVRGSEMRILGPNSSSLHYSPSTDWAQGGPIIEREKINVSLSATAPWMAWFYDGVEMIWLTDGPTPLIAAMRCYVASNLGDDVEIPKETT
jgi:hypothetical protein